MATRSATPGRGGCLGCLRGCGFHAYGVSSFRRRLRVAFLPFPIAFVLIFWRSY
jgi:hypothetical protein